METGVSTNHKDPHTACSLPSVIEVRNEDCNEDVSAKLDDFDFEPFHENIFRTLSENFDNESNIYRINDACLKLETCFIENNILNKNGSLKCALKAPLIDFMRYRDIDDAFVNMSVSESDSKPIHNTDLRKIDFKYFKDPFFLDDLPDTQRSVDEDNTSRLDYSNSEGNELGSKLEIETSLPGDDCITVVDISDDDESVTEEKSGSSADNSVNSTNCVSRAGSDSQTNSKFGKSFIISNHDSSLQASIRDVRIVIEKMPCDAYQNNITDCKKESHEELNSSGSGRLGTGVKQVARKRTGGKVIKSNNLLHSCHGEITNEINDVATNDEEGKTKTNDKMTRSAKRDLERVLAESTVNSVMKKTTELISEKIKDLQPSVRDTSNDSGDDDPDIHKTAEIVTNTILEFLTKNRCKNVEQLGKVISEDIVTKVNNTLSILKQSFQESTINELASVSSNVSQEKSNSSSTEHSSENVENHPTDGREKCDSVTMVKTAQFSNSPMKKPISKGHHSRKELEGQLNEMASIEEYIMNCDISTPLVANEMWQSTTQSSSNLDTGTINKEINELKTDHRAVDKVKIFSHLDSPASPDNNERGVEEEGPPLRKPITRSSLTKNNQALSIHDVEKSNMFVENEEVDRHQELKKRKVSRSDKDISMSNEQVIPSSNDSRRPRTRRQFVSKNLSEQNRSTAAVHDDLKTTCQPINKEEKDIIGGDSLKENKKSIGRRKEREINKDSEPNRRPVTRRSANKNIKETSFSGELDEQQKLCQTVERDFTEEKLIVDVEPRRPTTRRSSQKQKENVKLNVETTLTENVKKSLDTKQKSNSKTKKTPSGNRNRNKNVNPKNKLLPLSSKTLIDGQFLIGDPLSASVPELQSSNCVEDDTIPKVCRADSTTVDSAANDTEDIEEHHQEENCKVNGGILVFRNKKENNDFDLNSLSDQENRENLNSKDVSKLIEEVLDESLRENSLNKELANDLEDYSINMEIKGISSTASSEKVDSRVSQTVDEPFQILNDMITDIEENLLRGEGETNHKPDESRSHSVDVESPEVSVDSTSFFNYTIDDSFRLVIDESLFKDDADIIDSGSETTSPVRAEVDDSKTTKFESDKVENSGSSIHGVQVTEQKLESESLIKEKIYENSIATVEDVQPIIEPEPVAIEKKVGKLCEQSKEEDENEKENSGNIRDSLDEDKLSDSNSLKIDDPLAKPLTNEEKIAQLTRRDPRLLNEKKLPNTLPRDPRLRRKLSQVEENPVLPSSSPPMPSNAPIPAEEKVSDENSAQVKFTELKKTELKKSSKQKEVDNKLDEVKPPSVQPERPLSPDPKPLLTESSPNHKKTIEPTKTSAPSNTSIVKSGMPDNPPVDHARKKKPKKPIDEELLYKTPLSDLHDTNSDCSTYQRDGKKKRIELLGKKFIEVDSIPKHRLHEELSEDKKYSRNDTREERNVQSTIGSHRLDVRYEEEAKQGRRDQNSGQIERNHAHATGSKDSFEDTRRYSTSRFSRSVSQDCYSHTRRDFSRYDRELSSYRSSHSMDKSNYARQEKPSFSHSDKSKTIDKPEVNNYSAYPAIAILPEESGFAMGYGDMELGSSPLVAERSPTPELRNTYSPTPDGQNHSSHRKYDSDVRNFHTRNTEPQRVGSTSSSSGIEREYIHRRFDSPPRKRWRRSPSWSPERSKRRVSRGRTASPPRRESTSSSSQSHETHPWNSPHENNLWSSTREEQQPPWNIPREQQPAWNIPREESYTWNQIREQQQSWNNASRDTQQQQLQWNQLRDEQYLWNNSSREEAGQSSWNNSWNSSRLVNVWNSPPLMNRSPSPPMRYDNYRGRSSYRRYQS